MVSKVLKKIPLLNNKVFPDHGNHRKGWYTGRDFVEILNRERNRSDRSGLPLSFVLVDLSPLKIDGNKRHEREYHRFLEELIVVFSKNTRNFDVKYIGKRGKIGILLMDTGLGGATSYIRKISMKLREHLSENGMSGCVDWIRSIDVSVFPIRKAPDRVGLEELESPSKSGESQQEHWQNKESDTIRKGHPEICLNWQTVQPHEVIEGSVSSTLKEVIWSPNGSAFYRVSKRLMDVVGSVAGIALSLPLMMIISVLIKATSRGPVIFRQERLGYLGKTFTFLKFRTMRSGCDDVAHREYVEKLIEGEVEKVNRGTDDKPLFKLIDDSRVTRFGKLLRKWSLDELPQFFNVLSGSMSLVGPRPPIPYEVEKYQNWHWQRIMEAKPGITGLWQVYGRSQTTHAEMVRLDLRYIRNQSLLLDLKIIMKTFIAVFNTKGAF